MKNKLKAGNICIVTNCIYSFMAYIHKVHSNGSITIEYHGNYYIYNKPYNIVSLSKKEAMLWKLENS